MKSDQANSSIVVTFRLRVCCCCFVLHISIAFLGVFPNIAEIYFPIVPIARISHHHRHHWTMTTRNRHNPKIIFHCCKVLGPQPGRPGKGPSSFTFHGTYDKTTINNSHTGVQPMWRLFHQHWNYESN